VQTFEPAASPGRFSGWLWLARQAVDSGLQADDLEVPPMGPAVRFWRANAVRTFFEGPEEQS
jgi:hypothetical protein